MKLVEILLPLYIDQAYSYQVPFDMHCQLGDLVEVPLGNKRMKGVVWNDNPAPYDGDLKKVKAIIRKIPIDPIKPNMIKLINWMADYYLSPKGMCLRLLLNVPEALSEVPMIEKITKGDIENYKETKARLAVMDIVYSKDEWIKSELAEQAGVSTSVVTGLVKLGALDLVEVPKFDPFEQVTNFEQLAELADDQRDAADCVKEAIEQNKYATFLLDGVTGSGKTEVYFDAIKHAIKAGKQAVILLPEIALTVNFLKRFEERFGVKPAPWHSGLSKGARERIWRGVQKGDAQIVIGARSALFLPFKSLGVIVVDEEHDGAYKQDSGVMYHARDMAVVKANFEKIPVILASATPSLETYLNATSGKYHHLKLEKRHGGAKMPKVEAVDLRNEQVHKEKGKQRFLSQKLVSAIETNIQKGEQSLLFLNRRGYAPLTLCRACGHRIKCEQCEAWMVEHRFHNRLMCHHCGIVTQKPTACPSCEVEDKLIACGPGVERIMEEVSEILPDASVELLSSDGQMNVEILQQKLERIAKGEVDVIIGTQMIAKGHHFPNLTLVGVVDSDLGLENGDPRAAERTYQLLNQVAGRAGRGEKPGHVMLQSFTPESPVMQAMIRQNRDQFYKVEAMGRELAQLPPFGRLASVVVSSKELPKAMNFAREMIKLGVQITGIVILGPAPAPMSFVRGRHRVRILYRAPKGFKLQHWLKHGAMTLKPTGDLKVHVDTDPYSFF